jgi:protein-tyrosine-phosphatase
VLAALAPAERRALLAESLRLATAAPDWRPLVRDARRVSFVCHGNIIRSPYAAAAFRRLVAAAGATVEVVSAGVEARPGEAADPRAAASAAARGTPLDAHRATRLDAAHVAAADLLVVMDRLNLGRVLGRFPAAAGRTVLLGGCRPDGRLDLAEIHDPIAGTADDVRRSHDEIDAALARLAAALAPR